MSTRGEKAPESGERSRPRDREHPKSTLRSGVGPGGERRPSPSPARAGELGATLFGATSPRERALLGAMLECFARDRSSYSDVLEWSASGSEAGVDLARFSYAFPPTGRTKASVGRDVLTLAEAFGGAARAAAVQALRASASELVEQVLVGYARDRGASPRFKLYLQLSPGAGPAGLALARRVVGARAATRSDHLPLHLLGLDVGEQGLTGAKLYFEAPELEHPGLGHLGAGLVIHRLRGPDDPSFVEPSELDVSLAGPTLTWPEVGTRLAPHPVLAALGELSTRFALRPRRLSTSLSGAGKLTVYYAQDP